MYSLGEKSNKFMSKRENPLGSIAHSLFKHILLKLERVNRSAWQRNWSKWNCIMYEYYGCVASSSQWPQNVVKTLRSEEKEEQSGRDTEKESERHAVVFLRQWQPLKLFRKYRSVSEREVKLKRSNYVYGWHTNTQRYFLTLLRFFSSSSSFLFGVLREWSKCVWNKKANNYYNQGEW